MEYDEIRAIYKEYLYSQNISNATINTAYSDAFYLWRKDSKDIFWNVVLSNDFDSEARNELVRVLTENSAANVHSAISSYMSHLRRFRSFLLSDEALIPVKDKKKINTKSRKTINPSREIIINKMYSGDYLLQGNNIGHEIINLYKADDGKNYIYLNPIGTVDLSRDDNQITLLMVRRFAKKIYKVIAKAEGVSILEFANSKLPRLDRYQGQVELGLTYGGISLTDLFKKNIFRGEADTDVSTTFLANKVIKPKTQIFITDDSSVSNSNIFYIRTNKGFGKQTLREYYKENEKFDSFTDLNNIIENTELWEKADTTQIVSELPELQKDPYFNFLKITRQEDNELVFSNMFAHFFDINREVFARFVNDVLGIEIQTDFVIEREKENIDLLISDRNNVIVIENKIKSSINGTDKRHDIYGDLVQSQLHKYYHFVTSNDDYRTKTAHCFIFSPNYNRIELSKFSCGDRYTIVYYREIYNFFVENSAQFEETVYFDDFINALHRHTKDYDNDLEEEMQRRFQNAIYKIKNDRDSI